MTCGCGCAGGGVAACGCCAGTEALTPQATVNRPGLSTLAYRVGTHAAFLETMRARLSSVDYPELAGLTTRESGDPAIALLDAWATIGDLLTFYQERIANEGYLRTAGERWSILELARLVGYALRPGVSASAFLAFTLEAGHTVEIPAGTRAQSLPGPGELPQSFETSGKLAARADWNAMSPRLTRPQVVSVDPTTPRPDTDAALIDVIYLQGTATNLKPNDLLLFVSQKARAQVPRLVQGVEPDLETKRTKVTLQDNSVAARVLAILREFRDVPALQTLAAKVAEALSVLEQAASNGDSTALAAAVASCLRELKSVVSPSDLVSVVGRLVSGLTGALEPHVPNERRDSIDGLVHPSPGVVKLASIVELLAKPTSLLPRSAQRLTRQVHLSFGPATDVTPKLLVALRPTIGSALYSAWGKAQNAPSDVQVFAMRVKAPLFGHGAPLKVLKVHQGAIKTTSEWPVHERPDVVDLDAAYDKITPGSWVAVETALTTLTKPGVLIALAADVNPSLSRVDYGITGKVTEIRLSTPDGKEADWITVNPVSPAFVEGDANPALAGFRAIRTTTVYAQSEKLELAEEPIPDDVCGASIQLDGLYDGLEPGRWMIVAGERADVPGVRGLMTAELAMLGGVEDAVSEDPGDQVHTTLVLAGQTPDGPSGLAHCYYRDSVVIYGNVIDATHGETRQEVLGSGDGSKGRQEFTLRQPPLTFVSSPTPDGAESTLRVRVNDLLWREAADVGGLGPKDRGFTTRTDDDGKTTAVFGDGTRGARLPTGVENVKAVYRNGIGQAGNVGAGRISLLATKPLGVKGVVNPLDATGGADPDGRDQARSNVRLATSPLDRLVSVEDYADFARRFAGVAKASAARLSDGHAEIVQVTIAGVNDIPIGETSDLFGNLGLALHQYGDPYQRIQLATRQALLLVISAGIQVLPDYAWESVEPAVRAALLATFGFDRRELGQSAFSSEVIAAIQAVPGVAYVELGVFDSVSEDTLACDLKRVAKDPSPNPSVRALPDRRNPDRTNTDPRKRLLPAQLAYLTPAVSDTLILQVLP